MSETCTWTGEGDRRKWADTRNWKDGRVPKKGDLVEFPRGDPSEFEALRRLTEAGYRLMRSIVK